MTTKQSNIAALTIVYPGHSWDLWKFGVVPKGFWSDKENHKRFFNWLESVLNIRTKEDWYSVKFEDLKRTSGLGLLKMHYKDSLQIGNDTYQCQSF
jgi:hypothetical protein